jgi:hypothetical protein
MAEKVLTKLALEMSKTPLTHIKCRSTTATNIVKYQTAKNELEVIVSHFFII